MLFIGAAQVSLQCFYIPHIFEQSSIPLNYHRRCHNASRENDASRATASLVRITDGVDEAVDEVDTVPVAFEPASAAQELKFCLLLANAEVELSNACVI